MPLGYTQPPRVTRHKTLTRLRRVAQSNKPPGSGNAPIDFELFEGESTDWIASIITGNPADTDRIVLAVRDSLVQASAGSSINQIEGGIRNNCGYICVGDNTGVRKWCVTDRGMKFNYVGDTIVNSNVTLDPDDLGEWIATDSSSGPLVITVPDFGANLEAGSWLGFYDLPGDAKCNTVTLDPDTANTGYTFNGSSSPVTIIDTDFGAVFMIADANDAGNFILLKTPGYEDPGTWGTVVTVNANHTMARPEMTVLGDASGGNIIVSLADAKFYKDRIINVKKTDTSTNYVRALPLGAQTIDGLAFVNMEFRGENLQAASDGSNWWII